MAPPFDEAPCGRDTTMQTTTIHTDHNGVAVNAVEATADGTDV